MCVHIIIHVVYTEGELVQISGHCFGRGLPRWKVYTCVIPTKLWCAHCTYQLTLYLINAGTVCMKSRLVTIDCWCRGPACWPEAYQSSMACCYLLAAPRPACPSLWLWKTTLVLMKMTSLLAYVFLWLWPRSIYLHHVVCVNVLAQWLWQYKAFWMCCR